MGSYSTTSTWAIIYKMKSSVFAIGLLILATANASPPFLKAETCESLHCCDATTTKAPTTTGGSTASGASTASTSTTTATTPSTTTTTKPATTNKPVKSDTPTVSTTTVTTVAPTCENLNCDCDSGVGQIVSCVGILLVAFLVNMML